MRLKVKSKNAITCMELVYILWVKKKKKSYILGENIPPPRHPIVISGSRDKWTQRHRAVDIEKILEKNFSLHIPR